MKIYTIVGGVNGAGKSSLTGVLKAERSDLGKIIDVDQLAVQYGGFLEGGKRAVLLQQQYIAEGISFTQETTLSGQRPLRMIREAREAGYFIRLFYVGIGTVEEALARIRNRVAKGGHDIPAADVVRRFAERFPALLHVLDYVDEAVLYDNENGFRVVAEYRNGELLPIGPSPTWLKELMALRRAARQRGAEGAASSATARRDSLIRWAQMIQTKAGTQNGQSITAPVRGMEGARHRPRHGKTNFHHGADRA